MGWKAKTRRDDEGKRDGQKKRVGRGERRRRQAGKGAGRLRLFVLAMVVVVGFARQLYRDRLRILPRAELDENHAIRDDRHETRRDQRFHEQRGTQKQRAQPMMPGKEFAGFSHEAPFKWIGVPCRECCFPYSRTVALRWRDSVFGGPSVVEAAIHIHRFRSPWGTILKNRRYGGSGRHGAELA